MDNKLQTFVDNLTVVANLRNLDALHPIVFQVNNSGTNEIVTVACSVAEPDPLVLPVGGMWIVLDSSSPNYQKVFELVSVLTVKQYAVDSESAMLALNASTNDVALRTDTTTSYQLTGNDPSLAASWTKLLNSTDFGISHPLMNDPYVSQPLRMAWKEVGSWDAFVGGLEFITSSRRGTPGANGATGIKGPDGDEGLIGEVGDVGTIGLTGPTGPSVQGPEGPIGSEGPMGDIGLDGPDGRKGPDGMRGPQGRTGQTIVPDIVSGGLIDGGASSCTLPWGASIDSGDSVVAYQSSSVAYGAPIISENRVCTNGVLSGSFTFPACSTEQPQACTLPWGGTIDSGQHATAYQSATVPYGTTPVSETRVCTNGVLSGSYTYQSCVVNQPQTCVLPWGGTVASGASVTAYQASTVPYGSTCASELRVCDNGVLSGSYTAQSCSIGAAASCSLPWGGTIQNGASVTAYQAATVPYGSSCTSESRVCSNGVLSGSYTSQTCAVATPKVCALPWGGTIQSGQQVTAYQTPSAPFGSTCNYETRTCVDGVLSGTFTAQSCVVGTAAACALPWGGTTPSGTSVTAFQSATVPFGSSCVSESRTCTNGVLSGSYTKQACAVLANTGTPPVYEDLGSGAIWAWGSYATAPTKVSSPVAIGAYSDWKSIAAKSGSVIAGIRSDGTLWKWNWSNRASPIQVGSINTWKTVSISGTNYAAIRADGTLWTCGTYSGNGSAAATAVLTQIGTSTGWKWVQVFNGTYVAIKTDGTLWAWGDDQAAVLGTGAASRLVPTQIGTATNWKSVKLSVSSSYPTVVAVKTDGTLWVWGRDWSKLFDPSSLLRSFPVQVGSLTNWAVADQGLYHISAIKTDGTLWTWGTNGQSQLGDSTPSVGRSSPVQVGSLTNWKTLSCGDEHTLAIKTDGTLWTWGRGDFGQLGDSSLSYRSSPVQVGALNDWIQVEGGYYSGFALRSGTAVAPPASCTLPWGGTIASGTSVVAYQSANVASGGSCVSENRLCVNGVLSGSYTNQSCTVASPPSTSWTSKASMMLSKVEMGAAGTPSAALSFGGIGNIGLLTETELFDGAAWSSKANLNVPIVDNAGVGSSTSALSICGSTNMSTTYNVEAYDGSSWSTSVHALSQRRTLVAVGTSASALAVGGGNAASGVDYSLSTTELFNGTTWTTKPGLAVKRHSLAGAGTSTSAIVFGGNKDGAANAWLSSTEAFNGTSWSNGASLTVGKYVLAGAGVSNSAFGVGGVTQAGLSNSAEKFNGASWSSISSTNSINGLMSGVGTSAGTGILVFGGIYTEQYGSLF